MIISKEKNRTIETLRGIAILLVVAGHVIGSNSDGGMKIDFPSPFRYLYLWIDYIQMPLFVAIAGWVYALKPVSAQPFTQFVFGKFKRLLVPMATVGTIYFLIRYFTPGTNVQEDLTNLWRIYIFPYTMFWYLQALFLIFITIYIADKLNLIKTINGWAMVLAVTYVAYIYQFLFIAGNCSNLFSFQGALTLLPYFMIGLGVQRFGQSIYISGPLYCVMGLIGLVLLQFRWFYPECHPTLYSSLLPIWIAPTLIVLLNLRFTNRLMIYLGSYAYSIYLFHGFGTSGGRIILSYMGVESQPIMFFAVLIISTAAPIVIDMIVSKNRFLAKALLGKSSQSR